MNLPFGTDDLTISGGRVASVETSGLLESAARLHTVAIDLDAVAARLRGLHGLSDYSALAATGHARLYSGLREVAGGLTSASDGALNLGTALS